MATIPNMDELPALYAAARRQEEFWQEHYGALFERYGEQFVAVVDGEVVVARPGLDEFMCAVEELGLTPGRFWTRFLRKPGTRWIL